MTTGDDDYASAVAKTSNDQVNPNPSFEHGSAPGWKKTGGTWSAPTGGVIGTRYLTHTGYSHSVYNRVRLYNLVEGDFTGRFRVGVRFKEPSGQTGTIKLRLRAKNISYPTATSGCEEDQFAESADLNNPSTGGEGSFTILKTVTLSPSTVWSALTWTPYQSFASAGVDFEIRIENYLETTGPLVVDGTVHLDTGYIWPERS